MALAECDLAVARTEFVTVVGPSGCGKSTLLMIAAGLADATTGAIFVDGRPAGPPGPQRSVVFQRFALFPSETAAQNIEFGLRVAGIEKAEREVRVAEQLALMGLEQFRDSYPSELSGGMQQRVAIARALVVRPEILLMGRTLSERLMPRPGRCCRKRCPRLRRQGCTTRFSSSPTAWRKPSISATVW